MATAAKRRRKKFNIVRAIFIIVMLAYPVVQFLIIWLGVNIRSVMLVFQRYDMDYDVFRWVGTQNITNFFKSVANDEMYQKMLLTSFLYMPITCAISLPLSMIFSYFLFKKIPLSGVFRIIFFLPNIVPVVALTLAFRMPFDTMGFIYDWFVPKNSNFAFFSGDTARTMVYAYCVWAGLGYNIILLSGAIGRIPPEIMESARLDGVGFLREFFQFVIPLVWPTILTLVVLGMTSVLTLYLQPFLLMSDDPQTMTIALKIFVSAGKQGGANKEGMATMGLLCSLIWAPIILGTRKGLSKLFADVDF